MNGYLVRTVGKHVYGYAWNPLELLTISAGCLLVLLICVASLRHSRRTASKKSIVPAVLLSIVMPLCVLGFAPERYAPIFEMLASPSTRPVGLYRDLIALLAIMNALDIALFAWALVGLLDEGLGGLSPRWHQIARLLVIVALSGGVAAGSANYVQRITRLDTLPVADAAFAHPVHVGYEFTPRTELVEGAPHPDQPRTRRTPIEIKRNSGWKMASPPFKAQSPGTYSARVRYECEVYGFWVERDVSLVAEEERGDPLFAPKLGDTWNYRKYTAQQKLVRMAIQGRAVLPKTQNWEGATLEINGERIEDGLHYLQLKVTQHISRDYLLLESGGETKLLSTELEPQGFAVIREKAALYLPPPNHVPCRLSFLDAHGLCACAPQQTAPPRPAGLYYCEGIDMPPRKTSAGDQLGMALATLVTGGIAAIAIAASEGDTGYRSGLVLKEWIGGSDKMRYATPLPPEARPLYDSPLNTRYKLDARTVLMRNSDALRRCLKPGGRRQLALFLVVDAEGEVLHAAPAMTAPEDFAPELCAAQRVNQRKLPTPLNGPLAFEVTLNL